jgi:hypothetical protein
MSIINKNKKWDRTAVFALTQSREAGELISQLTPLRRRTRRRRPWLWSPATSPQWETPCLCMSLTTLIPPRTWPHSSWITAIMSQLRLTAKSLLVRMWANPITAEGIASRHLRGTSIWMGQWTSKTITRRASLRTYWIPTHPSLSMNSFSTR